MNDPGYNNLLKWGIENSEASRNDPTATPKPATQLDPEVLRQIMGGPSEAELMVHKMDVISDSGASLKQKRDAFDDFEQLIESIDNANNMENLQLWSRLVKQLDSEEDEMRMYAAWCIGTAVENNIRAQERLLVIGAIPTLVKLAIEDRNVDVRKKAVRALSCASRNFQPGLDVAVESVPSQFKPTSTLDAADMSSVDSLFHPLRAHAAEAR